MLKNQSYFSLKNTQEKVQIEAGKIKSMDIKISKV